MARDVDLFANIFVQKEPCMTSDLGRSLMKNKFKAKARVDKRSVVEHNNLAALTITEHKTKSKKAVDAIHNDADHPEMDVEAEKAEQVISLNFDRCIPPRAPFNTITKTCYQACEQKIFGYWKSRQKPIPYERNLETWRQLWLTCEKSDVIAQVLDARNPGFFFVRDLPKMYPDKKHVMLINKSDLMFGHLADTPYSLSLYSDPPKNTPACHRTVTESIDFLREYEHVFYSSKDTNRDLINFVGKFKNAKVGFIGYPNVGKSSTLNLILESKKVRISATPGKTQHLQSMVFNDMVLIDCPGLVFPRYSKFDLIINGILNVDHMMDYGKFFHRLVAFVGEDVLKKKYCVPSGTVEQFCDASGLSKGQLFKRIVKDYVAGVL